MGLLVHEMNILNSLHEARYVLQEARETALRYARADIASHLERADGCIDSAVDELRGKGVSSENRA